MATRLKKVKVNEVSLVTRPAINRQFLLYKSEDGMEEENMVEEIVKTEETVTETPLVTEPVVEVAKEEPVVEAPVVEAPIEVVKEEPAPEPIPEPIVEKAKPRVCPECGEEMDEEEEGEMHKGCGKVKKEAEPEPVPEPVIVNKELEDVTKALEQERIEKAAIMKELEELKKAAELAKQVEITKAFIVKAATELKSVPTVVPETFGPVLKAAADKLDKAEFDAIYGALVAASNFIKQNASLTKEFGVGGQDLSADPAAQLDSIAKSYVVKDTSLTYAKAYSLACDQNPHIYAQHVKQARNR